jgi:multidrug efflux pump subunit AcrA (membrane-fusion protein)
LLVLGGLAILGIVALIGREFMNQRPQELAAASISPPRIPQAKPTSAASTADLPEVVELDQAQQEAIKLRTAPVEMGTSFDVLEAPGRIAPDEARYAYITPRASGVVREVTAHIGQDVKAGDLLATIDSPEVAQTRLDLVTRLQELEIAKWQADWQSSIYQTTLELIERLKANDSPETIHDRFEDRPVGVNRERLLTAYAQFRLDRVRFTRNKELRQGNAISLAAFQEVQAEFEASQATYQALMDRMGFESKLENTKAQQALRQAETAVQVARERLRVLGVKPDGTEPTITEGKVVGVKPDGTLNGEGGTKPTEKPEKVLPARQPDEAAAVAPVGAHPVGEEHGKELKPISTFSMWAPFDGTILDRAMIVPGVAVEKGQKIYTLADLATVWVEVYVHESDFDNLNNNRDDPIQFTSPAYPGRTFQGKVIYSGDLVDEKSRSVLLLARAENPDRALKPGMFVEVKIHSPSARQAALIPASALLTEDDDQFVYVRIAPERFERRPVVAGTHEGEQVAILKGLEAGEVVVIEGAFKLSAKAMREEGREP